MKHIAVFFSATLLCASAYAATTPASPDAAYPSRSVRMLVPYPPGGGLDLPGRVVGQKFADSTGRQLLLDTAAAPAV